MRSAHLDQVLSKEDILNARITADLIRSEFENPFKDPREDPAVIRTQHLEQRSYPSKELFYDLIDQSERTFKSGMILPATVVKVFNDKSGPPYRIQCKLENGLDAIINDNDIDLQKDKHGHDKIDVGSVVQGRVEFKIGEMNFDETDKIILKCKREDLRSHEKYIIEAEINVVDHKDSINKNFQAQEEHN